MLRAAILALAVLLAGCDGGGSGGSGDAGLDTTITSPPDSSPNPTPPDGAQEVEPRPGMDDVHPISFDSAIPSADGRSLTVAFTGGVAPCFVLDHVDVDIQPDAVTVTLYAGHEPAPEPVACIEIAAFYETTVELSESLAGRPVLDGALAVAP
ncbi:MAG TPA: hypothetical protein VFF40_04230 [Acidimicrobiia bacterium]|nr:hypothetical protein [Acidimicrobiia bacterium]